MRSQDPLPRDAGVALPGYERHSADTEISTWFELDKPLLSSGTAANPGCRQAERVVMKEQYGIGLKLRVHWHLQGQNFHLFRDLLREQATMIEALGKEWR